MLWIRDIQIQGSSLLYHSLQLKGPRFLPLQLKISIARRYKGTMSILHATTHVHQFHIYTRKYSHALRLHIAFGIAQLHKVAPVTCPDCNMNVLHLTVCTISTN